MESELQKFRRKKQLEQKKEEIKTKIKDTANSWAQSFYQAILPSWNDDDVVNDEVPLEDSNNGTPSTSSAPQSFQNAPNQGNKWLLYAGTCIRFLAWLLVYLGFVKIGFGAVFFTISLLIFIYLNTRKRKAKGEVSAYSVFNKDCQSIDGTLKAEHLEKQLLYRGS